ncbi:MAG: hypothetical protein ACI94C_001377, partial [Sediminicola sp.]
WSIRHPVGTFREDRQFGDFLFFPLQSCDAEF